MKLFLTSIGANCVQELERIFHIVPSKSLVGFIPTAGDVYAHPTFVAEDRNRLLKLGYPVKNVSLSKISDERLRRELKSCSIIFVAGGNTFYLLQEARKSGFSHLIKDLMSEDKIYVGSSAGSVLVGKSIELVKTLDDSTKASELSDFNGLGLIKQAILPHAGNPKYSQKYNKILQEFKERFEIIQITDSQAYIVNGKIKKKIEIRKK